MIAASKWGLVMLASVVLVGIAVASPFAVHAILADDVSPETANWTAAAVGLVMVIALAIPWVLLRSRRDQAARGLR